MLLTERWVFTFSLLQVGSGCSLRLCSYSMVFWRTVTPSTFTATPGWAGRRRPCAASWCTSSAGASGRCSTLSRRAGRRCTSTRRLWSRLTATLSRCSGGCARPSLSPRCESSDPVGKSPRRKWKAENCVEDFWFAVPERWHSPTWDTLPTFTNPTVNHNWSQLREPSAVFEWMADLSFVTI